MSDLRNDFSFWSGVVFSALTVTAFVTGIANLKDLMNAKRPKPFLFILMLAGLTLMAIYFFKHSKSDTSVKDTGEQYPADSSEHVNSFDTSNSRLKLDTSTRKPPAIIRDSMETDPEGGIKVPINYVEPPVINYVNPYARSSRSPQQIYDSLKRILKEGYLTGEDMYQPQYRYVEALNQMADIDLTVFHDTTDAVRLYYSLRKTLYTTNPDSAWNRDVLYTIRSLMKRLSLIYIAKNQKRWAFETIRILPSCDFIDNQYHDALIGSREFFLEVSKVRGLTFSDKIILKCNSLSCYIYDNDMKTIQELLDNLGLFLARKPELNLLINISVMDELPDRLRIRKQVFEEFIQFLESNYKIYPQRIQVKNLPLSKDNFMYMRLEFTKSQE